jgi:hypothetical protein
MALNVNFVPEYAMLPAAKILLPATEHMSTFTGLKAWERSGDTVNRAFDTVIHVYFL